jgi:hypothetical protein
MAVSCIAGEVFSVADFICHGLPGKLDTSASIFEKYKPLTNLFIILSLIDR